MYERQFVESLWLVLTIGIHKYEYIYVDDKVQLSSINSFNKTTQTIAQYVMFPLLFIIYIIS